MNKCEVSSSGSFWWRGDSCLLPETSSFDLERQRFHCSRRDPACHGTAEKTLPGEGQEQDFLCCDLQLLYAMLWRAGSSAMTAIRAG